MKILAIDTSGRSLSAAVAEDGALLAYNWLGRGNSGDEALMPCIDALLSGLGALPDGFDAYAAVVGPGSFTGLRIGLAVVKAFAYARGTGIVGIPTLDALARNLVGYGGALLCPVIDARNNRVYWSAYRAVDGRALAQLAAADVVGVDDLSDRIMALTGVGPDLKRVVFNGDAAAACRAAFSRAYPDVRCDIADERDLLQNAAAAALLACERATATGGGLTPPELLLPNYMNAGYAAPPAIPPRTEPRVRCV